MRHLSKIINTSVMGAICAIIGITHPALAVEKIGVSAAVRGDVNLIPQGGAARKASTGGDVNFNETISSGANSGLQVMLLDETTFTIGSNAQIIIDEMVYDPGGESKLLVTVAEGAFRYLSGEIAKQNPDNVSIQTPYGNIGIRGTNLFAVQKNGGMFVGLLGPGAKNNTGDKPGGFVFTNEHGSRNVRRAGFGFSVVPGQMPGEIVRIPPEVISKLSSAIAPESNDKTDKAEGNADAADGDGTTSASGDSGQALAETKEQVSIQQAEQEIISAITAQSISSATTSVATSTPYAIARVSDITALSGSALYSQAGVGIVAFPSSGGFGELTPKDISDNFATIARSPKIGSYDFNMTANFTSRTLNGSYSNIAVPSLGISGGSLAISYGNFTSGTGNAVYTPYQFGAWSGGNYDANIIFLKTAAGGYPNIYQNLNITRASMENEIGFGGSVISPK